MSVSTVSTISTQTSLSSALQAEQATLSLLSEQLSSEQKHSDLTDYSATDVQNIINIQSAATQKQAYVSVIGTVSNNLSIYDTTLTDLESISTLSQSLSASNPTYNANTVANISASATSYLKAVTDDLNQQVNGRYIYAGTRYNTAPVSDLSTLPASTLTSDIYSDGASLPSYDSAYTGGTLTAAASGSTITIGGTPAVGQTASATVNGTTYTYTVTASDTTATIATQLGNMLSTAGVAVNLSVSGQITLTNSSDTLNSASSTTTSTAAYTTDSATVDTNYTVNYGISSDNPAIQKLVAGLRYLQAAGNSTDAATYKTYMSEAQTLLSSALTSIQSLHTVVANNTNIMTNEQTKQNNQITNLTSQLADIEQVDVTQVSTEITSLQSILQASYSVTGSILKMSIVSYL